MSTIPVTISGNLTSDPALKFLPSGSSVAEWSVAVNHRRFDRDAGQYVDDGTTFVDCTAYGKMAEHVADSLRKGMPVTFTGTMRQRTWEDREGKTQRRWELRVANGGPDLARCIVGNVSKPPQDGGQNGAPHGGQRTASQPSGPQGGQSPTQGGPGPQSGAQASVPYGLHVERQGGQQAPMDPWGGQAGGHPDEPPF